MVEGRRERRTGLQEKMTIIENQEEEGDEKEEEVGGGGEGERGWYIKNYIMSLGSQKAHHPQPTRLHI